MNKLAKQGVTPNQVTISAMVLSSITGLLLILFPSSRLILCCVPIVLMLRMALNAIDGILAREYNLVSNLGTVLNELGDILSDVVLFIPFIYITPSLSGFVVIIIILAIVSEMTGIIAVQVGKERRYDGPMGKSDRAFVIAVVAILLGLGFTPDYWLSLVWLSVSVLLILTIFNRARGAL